MGILDIHRDCIGDRKGQELFRRAIRESLRGGELVLDLGTGTGIHALFACEAGAKRVFALDRMGIVEIARETAAANQRADSIVFLQGASSKTDLPEKVDLIVTHLGFGNHLSYLIDARKRFLKDSGSVIPAATDILCAPIECPETYEREIGFWGEPHFGLDFSPVRRAAANQIYEMSIRPESFLAPPSRIARVDFRTADEPGFSGAVTVRASRSGVLHGLGVWFNVWLTDRILAATDPPLSLPASPWGHVFLPIEEPVPMETGFEIEVNLGAYARTGSDRIFTWSVEIAGGGKRTGFRHSTFQGTPLALDAIHRLAPSRTPALSPRGRARRLALSLCDGTTTLGAITDEVFRQCAPLFPSREEADAFVAQLLIENGS